jgi:hypothetical protein
MLEEDIMNFFSMVDMNEETGCWLWTGYKTPLNGYGQIVVDGHIRQAHRLSWMLSGNTIPRKHTVRHTCINKDCVNPDHLKTVRIKPSINYTGKIYSSSKNQKKGVFD